jgi:DNA-binding transcriptional MerR regulator
MITFGLAIGEVARRVGVSIQSIRRGESEGCLPFEVQRTTMGWRRFAVEDVEKLQVFCDERRSAMKRNNQPK